MPHTQSLQAVNKTGEFPIKEILFYIGKEGFLMTNQKLWQKASKVSTMMRLSYYCGYASHIYLHY